MAGNVLNEIAWAMHHAGYPYRRIARVLAYLEERLTADELRIVPKCPTCRVPLEYHRFYSACPRCGGEWLPGKAA